jgi:hypothetical protein
MANRAIKEGLFGLVEQGKYGKSCYELVDLVLI